MKDKKELTYGEVAYNAYCHCTNWKSLISGADLPKWETLRDDIKHAWETAADAAIQRFTTGI